MLRDLVLLELIDYAYFDAVDNEDVENRNIIGYFTDEREKSRAIKLCERVKKPGEIIKETKLTIDCAPNQKFVYVLFYEYSLLNNGEYIDYYYNFEPMSNRQKCLKQKNSLLEIDKYKPYDNKIFDDTPDGFRIQKIKINYIDYVNAK